MLFIDVGQWGVNEAVSVVRVFEHAASIPKPVITTDMTFGLDRANLTHSAWAGHTLPQPKVIISVGAN